MNREKKFRAWDKKKKKWIDLSVLTDWGNCPYLGLASIDTKKDGVSGLVLQSSEDWVWVQYTGLKDKNGKEIWEGDVVRLLEEKYCRDYERLFNEKAMFGNKYYVMWYEGRFVLAYKFPNGSMNWVDEKIRDYCLEVIGNIYEDGNLLND